MGRGPWPGKFHCLTLRKRKGPHNGGPRWVGGVAGGLHHVNGNNDFTVPDHVFYFMAHGLSAVFK